MHMNATKWIYYVSRCKCNVLFSLFFLVLFVEFASRCGSNCSLCNALDTNTFEFDEIFCQPHKLTRSTSEKSFCLAALIYKQHFKTVDKYRLRSNYNRCRIFFQLQFLLRFISNRLSWFFFFYDFFLFANLSRSSIFHTKFRIWISQIKQKCRQSGFFPFPNFL